MSFPAVTRPSSAAWCLLLALAVVAGSGLLAAGCGTGTNEGPPCEDGADNDEDGLIDDADPSCAAGNEDENTDPTRDCNDGDDNDDDGLTDYPADPGCTDGQDNGELNSPTPDCDDGVDNDGDGKTDYPDDPGCFSALQAGETDDCPDGERCPECGNGVDDDEDGDVDYPDDDGCAAASDAQERTQDLTACNGSLHEPLTVGVAMGMLVAGSQATLTASTCGGTGVGTGVENVYEFYVAEPRVMVASTNLASTVIDTVLYVRSRCADTSTELACSDDVSSTVRKSTITVALDPGYYYLIVDGKNSTALGNYQLEVEFFPGTGTACDPEASDPCAPGLLCRTIPGSAGPTCEEPVCSDGRDDDDDGLIDYPFDPGCASVGDATENDTCPEDDCPDCANGADDDGDGAIDYPLDTDCAFAGQIVEGCAAEMDPIVAITTPTTTGTTTGAHDNFDPSCGSTGGIDVAHILNLPVPVQSLVLDTVGSTFDTLLFVSTSSCNGTYLGCDDDGAGYPLSRLTLTNLAAGGYAVFVDGYSSSHSGAYTLHVQGTVAPQAACTDPMFSTGVLACPATHPCNGTICALAACNDGINNGDGDTLFDYPNDPGCTSPNDATETDSCPDGDDCPACSNDEDDDGDGMIDYGVDTGCPFAGADDETGCASASDPFDEITTPTVSGTFATQSNDLAPSCGGASGRDVAYLLDVPFPLSTLYLDTEGSVANTILAVRPGSCSASDLACDDTSGDDGSDAYLVMNDVPANRYAVIVDTNGASTGAYSLHVRGVIAEGGRCDPDLSAVFQCVAHTTCAGTPGVETCRPMACADGVNNGDGDALVDALDPGCMSLADTSEADPATAPQCADAADNDGDGLVDYPNDLGCKRAGDATELLCNEISGLPELATARVTASTSGAGDNFEPGCVTTSDAPERVYSVTVPGTMANLRFNAGLTVTGSYNSVLYVRRDSCSTDLACSDTPNLNIAPAQPGTYFVFVDGAGIAEGTFTLDVSGVINAGQPCDPLQIQSGMFTCSGTTTCTNNVCQ